MQITGNEKEGDLKVYHIPQVPMKPFEIPVASTDEAIKIMDILADYDTFQLENNIKPDYCNVQGLVIFEGGEWVDWYNEDGEGIDDIRH